MKEIKSKDEFEKLAEEKKLLLVDFYADWCGPCQMMLPIIEELANDFDDNKKVEIVKVNIDELPQIPARFNVMSVPTFLFLKNGEEADRIVGATTKENLAEIIKNNTEKN